MKLKLEELPSRIVPTGAFDASSGTWLLRGGFGAGVAQTTFQYGPPGSIPLVGDFDGDGLDDVGAFVRESATWLLRTGLGAGQADLVFQYGPPGSLPVVLDVGGDGKDEIAAFSPDSAIWHVRLTASPGRADRTFQYGPAHCTPVAGDWDGDGRDGIGAVSEDSVWFLRGGVGPGLADRTFQYGGVGWTPLVGDFDEDGKGDVASVSPDGVWHARFEANAGVADAVFSYGGAGSVPLAGYFGEPEGESIFRFSADASLLAILNRAARRWQGAILDPISVSVDVEVLTFDGKGGAVAFGGPTQSEAGIARVGRIGLDADDLPLLRYRTLLAVLAHEIGHVLGIGTLWRQAGLVGEGSDGPVYLGEAANREYRVAFGGEGRIPLSEDRAHWDEDGVPGELLGPIVGDGERIGRISLASLIDLGYRIDLGRAEAYRRR